LICPHFAVRRAAGAHCFLSPLRGKIGQIDFPS
jgi:hypothetical protein